MTRRMAFFLLKLGLLGLLVAFFVRHGGHVALEWQNWRADMPLGAVLVLLLLAGWFLSRFGRIWRGLMATPGRLAERRRRRRRENGYRALTRGLVASAAGEPAEALRQARRAETLLDDPPLTRLLSAQAAQLNGDEAAARRYFESMLDDPDAAFLGLRGLMMQALKAQDDAAALALAERAAHLRPNTHWVIRELLNLQRRAGNWDAALETSRKARRLGAIPAARCDDLGAEIHLEMARDAEREGKGREALKQSREALRLAPATPAAGLMTARLLADTGQRGKATRTVEDIWRRRPDPALATLYHDLAAPGTSDLEQVRRFEKLLALNPDHLESRLALGKVALDAGLWGLAREHLAEPAARDPGPRLCRLMARLEEEEHQDMAAARRWLALAASDRAGETTLPDVIAPESGSAPEPDMTSPAPPALTDREPPPPGDIVPGAVTR